jgi:hypothetical protein
MKQLRACVLHEAPFSRRLSPPQPVSLQGM